MMLFFRVRRGPIIRGRSQYQVFALLNAFSIALVSRGESGSMAESNRAITLPSGPTRNFVKFQPISPPVCE
jgi:hypothetical protein